MNDTTETIADSVVFSALCKFMKRPALLRRKLTEVCRRAILTILFALILDLNHDSGSGHIRTLNAFTLLRIKKHSRSNDN